MNITYACPNCTRTARDSFGPETQELRCPHCGGVIEIPSTAVNGNHLQRCLICPSSDLYVRKDFPQRLGLTLVAIGIVGSSIAWAYTQVFWTFAILFATALADVLLFVFVGETLMCYRCHAEYRGVEPADIHRQFDLETHERHRQIAARMKAEQ